MALVAHGYPPCLDDICSRGSHVNTQSVPASKEASSESLERLWKDYFRDPSQWWDYRKSKTNPRTPDFQHKTTQDSLWIFSWFNPLWVQEELRRRALQAPTKSVTLEDGVSCAGKKTAKTAARNIMAENCQEVEEAEEVSTIRKCNRRTFQEDTGGFTSYESLLKVCAQQKDLQKGSKLHEEIVEKGLLQHDAFVGSSLVNMYAKCGALAKAQDVFDELPIHNVVTWNALIGGYARQGHGDEALNCFKQMQHDGFSPDSVTFACVLKACGSVGAVDKGAEIHAQIARDKSLENDIVVGTALVDMYGKCGLLSIAQQVFDKLPARNVVSWNVLIARYAEHGHSDEALKCFERMQIGGIPPSAATFLSILKACSSIGIVATGEDIHAKIVREGFQETDPAVGTALIDMYLKCGAFAKGQEMFNELSEQNVVSWNMLIAGYGQHGHGEKALSWFDQMQLVGLSPDAVTFTCALKACGSIEAVGKGQEIHAQIVRDGLFEKDVAVAGALVDMYVKCGALQEAQDVSDELPERNVVVWTTLMAGYAHYGHGEEALYCFEHMQHEGFPPDAITFTCILKACGSIGAADKGKEVHNQIVKDRSLERDIVVGTALVDMYAKCGLLEKAQELFNQLPVRNVVSWNALIAGYAQYAHGEEALNCFEQMQLEGFSPDTITFLGILKACGSLGAADKGQEIHAESVKDSLLDEDVVLGTALVDMYARCGMLVDAQEVFYEIPVQDLVLWNALVSGYAQHEDEEVFNCFEQMQIMGFSPDAVTFTSILKACGSIGAVYKGLEAHDDIVREGLLENDMIVGNALVDMYANCGMLAEAQEVFNKLPIRDVVLWNSLISGYAQLGEDEIAFSLFDRMVGDGKEPDSFTFTIVLNTCSHRGLLDKGEMYFETMSVGLRMIPNLEHLACIVDLFCRAGHIEKSVAVINRTQFSGVVTVWHTVLAACRRWQNTELGRWVFEQAVQLDESNAAAYVCMSNIYATDGKQENVDKIEALKVEGPMRKSPGSCWWTDTSGFVHLFAGGDTRHPQIKAIRAKWKDIALKLVQESHVQDNSSPCLLCSPEDVSDDGKEDLLCRHSERLAIVCGLVNTVEGTPIRVSKNMRICADCHSLASLISKLERRKICVRDAYSLHTFEGRNCFCGQIW